MFDENHSKCKEFPFSVTNNEKKTHTLFLSPVRDDCLMFIWQIQTIRNKDKQKVLRQNRFFFFFSSSNQFREEEETFAAVCVF